MALEDQQAQGGSSPALHIKAAVFPISPGVHAPPLCWSLPSVTLTVALLPRPAVLPLRLPPLPNPERAFQAS